MLAGRRSDGLSRIVLLHGFLLQVILNIARPAAAYEALELGASPGMLGLVAASFTFLPMFLALHVGRATDDGHGGPVLAAGSVLILVAACGLVLGPTSLMLLLLWNVVLGFGHLLGIIGEQSMVARGASSGFERNFGLYTFATSAGQAAGPLVIAAFGGARLVPDTGSLFIAVLALSVLLLGTTLPLARQGQAPASTGSITDGPTTIRGALVIPPRSRRTMAGMILVSLAFTGALDMTSVYLPALGVERDIPVGFIGVLLAARACATMLVRLLLSALVSRWGRRRLMISCTVLGAVSVGALALPLPLWAMSLAMIGVGFAFGLSQPLTMTIITLAAPPGTRGTWLALRMAGNRVGQTAIPAVVGLLALTVGVASVFAATAVLLLATTYGARQTGEWDK